MEYRTHGTLNKYIQTYMHLCIHVDMNKSITAFKCNALNKYHYRVIEEKPLWREF
jgi:hypothetical protein